MKTLYLFVFLYLISFHSLIAQQDAYDWRLGVHSGMMGYHGDLNSRFMASGKAVNKNTFSMMSYGVSLEKSMSQSWSGKILYTNGQFYANDRAIHWDGRADSDRSNYGRSLNAKTDIQDLSVIFTYYFDNDYLFARRAFVSPYLTVGLGLTRFEVYGDLYDALGQRYHYWSDNSIRTEAETSANDAPIVQQDGKYETNLSQLDTETDYNTTVFNIPFGAGIKFRISSRFNVNLDLTARYAYTDYLDDVSGDYRTEYANDIQAYAANPTNRIAESRGNSERNDFYTFTSISLHYNFGKKSEKFIAPKIYPSSSYVAPQMRESEANITESQKYDTLPSAGTTLFNRPKFSGFDFFNPIPEAYDSMPMFSTSGINTYEPTNRQLDFPKPFPSGYPYAVSDGKIDLQNDTLRQLEYEVKKIKLQNELYTLKRDSPDPKIKGKFMQDNASQSFVPVDEQTPVNATPAGVSATPDSTALKNLQTPTPRLSAGTDSVQLNKLQNDIEELQQTLSNKAYSQNQRPEDIATIQQLQRRVEVLSAELENQRNPTRTIQNTGTPNLVILPQNSANNDIRDVERELQALSGEILTTRNAQAAEDSARQRSLENAMRTEEALKAKIVALDSQVQATDVRNDSLRQARIIAERDSLEDEIKQLQQSLSDLKYKKPAAPSKEAVAFPELPKTALFFGVNSSTLNDEDKQRIKKVARILIDYPRMQVTLQGYTDKTGRAEYNMLLSQKRARAVQHELELSGVTSNRIITESNGVDNDLKNKASQYGRRVEIIFSTEK